MIGSLQNVKPLILEPVNEVQSNPIFSEFITLTRINIDRGHHTLDCSKIVKSFKGVAVEIEGSVDHFDGHIPTQRGRKPQ